MRKYIYALVMALFFLSPQVASSDDKTYGSVDPVIRWLDCYGECAKLTDKKTRGVVKEAWDWVFDEVVLTMPSVIAGMSNNYPPEIYTVSENFMRKFMHKHEFVHMEGTTLPRALYVKPECCGGFILLNEKDLDLNSVAVKGVLVHEMVHHVQTVYNLIMARCSIDHERMAYFYQYHWLREVAGLDEDSVEVVNVKKLYMYFTRKCVSE